MRSDDFEHDIGRDPMQVRHLRRAVAEMVADNLGPGEVATAELLVSELLSNVLLHAGGRGMLKVRAAPTRVRVEVIDESPVIPQPRRAIGVRVTGRGLALVEALAPAWGVEEVADGKCVWFELGPEASSDGGRGGTTVETGEDGTLVQLLDVPVELLRATLDYGDSILREMTWMAMDDASDVPVPDPGGARVLNLDAVLAALDDLHQRGVEVASIDARFPASAGSAAIDRLALVDEAHRVAAEGALLSLPSVPEVSDCRRWLLTQIDRQLRGEAPEPWSLELHTQAAEPVVALTDEERELVESSNAVLADTTNRIVHVAPQVAGALGWTPEALHGRRLAELIPFRLREAHLSGFTRYQLGGEPQILDRALELPILCRDGRELVARLRITVLKRPGGERTYLATFDAIGH